MVLNFPMSGISEVRRTQPRAEQKVEPERRTLDLFTKKNPKKYLINVYVCSFSIDKKRWKGKRQKSITNKTNGKGVVDCIFRFPPIDFEQNKKSYSITVRSVSISVQFQQHHHWLFDCKAKKLFRMQTLTSCLNYIEWKATWDEKVVGWIH